jgi:hypothetical protein
MRQRATGLRPGPAPSVRAMEEYQSQQLYRESIELATSSQNQSILTRALSVNSPSSEVPRALSLSPKKVDNVSGKCCY